MSGKTKFKKDVHTQFVTWLEEIKGAPYKFRCYACGHMHAATSFDKSHDKVKKLARPTAGSETSFNLENLWKLSMFV